MSDIANDEAAKHNLDFWTGYILLIAVGTLLYIALMHILPEVYKSEHCHSHIKLGEQYQPINQDEEANKGHPTEKRSQQEMRFSRGV